MWRSIGAVLNRWSCFLSPMHSTSLSHFTWVGQKVYENELHDVCTRNDFYPHGWWVQSPIFPPIFPDFCVLLSGHPITAVFPAKLGNRNKSLHERLKTAKNQVLLNHRQMKPSCLASRIYYGGTSFSIRQTRKKGATLVQVPFLRWRVRGFISFGNRPKHWVESLRIGVFLRALPAAALSTDRGQPFVESLRSED